MTRVAEQDELRLQFRIRDSDEPEAESQDEVEEKPPTPDLSPPVRRAARKKGKQPSLSVPERPSRSRSPLART